MQQGSPPAETWSFWKGGGGYTLANSASFLDGCGRNLCFFRCLEKELNFCVLQQTELSEIKMFV